MNRTTIRGCRHLIVPVLVLAGLAAADAPGEVVFQDFFTSPAGNITNSVPWISVQGNGWQGGAGALQLATDGNGHLYNGASNAAAAAGVPLLPIGPHGSMTASAIIQLPTDSTESVDLGFCSTNGFLTASASGGGPWVQVLGTGNLNFYGGAGQSNQMNLPNAFTNTGIPVEVLLTYDAFKATASLETIKGGVTNLILDQRPVTNSAGPIAPRYFVFQFSTNLTAPTARWATAATVDWRPRPTPMLALPATVVQTNFIGSPGTNDLLLIQNAFNLVLGSTNATEIRFMTGATYVITNSSLVGDTPLSLFRATNVLVNGNGCKILITNPRIGLLTVNTCSNVIVEGFSVDYNPLPFTQGTVTHNFYTGNDVPKEAAIEFLADTGYPSPTNANYTDANAVSAGLRWGMVIDPARPGRVANGAYTQCFYTNVVQTNVNGAFKVRLNSTTQAQTIQPGDRWCMIARWNNAIIFNTFLSCQVTFMNDTNYTGAGPSYVGQYSPLVCEINDLIQPGPPPTGATAPRLRASNADGGLFIDSRIGPWVQGCNFTALSDDTANTCSEPFIITNTPVHPTNTFTLFVNGSSGGTPAGVSAFQAEVGDEIAFFNATNGVVFDHATVISVTPTNVTFDHVVSNIVAGTYDTNTLLVNETLNTSAVYLNNQFINSAFHGIYCRADNMLIAHNSVSGMGKNDISAFPNITRSFLNFFVPTNVVIMDNVLSDGGFSYEAVHNSIPAEQPAYALIELHKTDVSSHYVTNGLEISGIRILYNAFLNWRRAPLTLHNATDVNVIGNYFGPPATNDALVPLTNDVIADLWASDYPNLIFTNNVNGTTLPDSKVIQEDGTITAVANAFQALSAPKLTASLSGTNLLVAWVSPAPAFALQQINSLGAGTNSWVDITNATWVAGQSNFVTEPLPPSLTNVFFRVRQE